MSLQPREPSGVPEETARVARASFPRGSACMRMRDELGAVYGPGAPRWLREVPAVGVLGRIWTQQYHAPGGPRGGGAPGEAVPRDPEDLPPSGVAIRTPHDAEARRGEKRGAGWLGYKVHLTEACGEGGPHLITDVATCEATEPDVGETAAVQERLGARGLGPREHLVDAGYVDAEHLVSSRGERGVELVGPALPDHSWQAREGLGYDGYGFAIDWEGRSATCPEGNRSRNWMESRDRPGYRVGFDPADCAACPSRARCTSSVTAPRMLTLHPREEHEALRAARERQRTGEFRGRYAERAGVEGTISQGVRAFGLRRTRYEGLAKTRLQHTATGAAINLARLADWWGGVATAQTRTSRFAALAAA